jgi:hypothetical protein
MLALLPLFLAAIMLTLFGLAVLRVVLTLSLLRLLVLVAVLILLFASLVFGAFHYKNSFRWLDGWACGKSREKEAGVG